MRILFVIQGMNAGGAERVMSVLCNSFSCQGDEIFLGLTEDASSKAYILDKRVKVVDLTCKANNSLSFFYRSSRAIRKGLVEIKPDCIVSFITRANICTLLASIGLNVPVLISERNNPQVDPPSKITRFIRDMVYPFADGVVFQTVFARSCFKPKIQFKSRIIVNPVSDVVKQFPTINEKKKIIISVGRLEAQKNFQLLINSFHIISSEYPNYNLEIYGEGSLRKELESLIFNLGENDRIFLRGYTDNPFYYLSTAEVFVLPSLYEGMPNTLIEAMCMGCACVATDVPAYGARDVIIDGENGILVPSNNVEKMASSIRFLLDDESTRNEISKRAKGCLKIFDSESVCFQWRDYIKDLVKQNKNEK